MAHTTWCYFSPCFLVLCFHVCGMEEQLGAALGNNHAFSSMVYSAGMQGVLTVMGFHKCVVLGHAVDLSICAAVACCNCSFWLSSEAYNGLWGCLPWALAVHLADALWHLLGTFSTSLWSLMCLVLLFLSQEGKLLGEMFKGVVEQPWVTVDFVKIRLLKLQVSWIARLSWTILNADLWYYPAAVNLENATSALVVPFLWPPWVPLLWSRHGWSPTKCWRKEVCFEINASHQLSPNGFALTIIPEFFPLFLETALPKTKNQNYFKLNWLI